MAVPMNPVVRTGPQCQSVFFFFYFYFFFFLIVITLFAPVGQKGKEHRGKGK